MTTLAQRSFAGGEIAPTLYGRVDQVKYATGLRIMRNFLLMRHGGAASRPGTTFVGEVKDSAKTVRYVEFIFNAAQTCVLEFGDLYMRIHQNGAQVTEAAKAVTGASNANPCAMTVVGHGYSSGDEVYVSGIVGAIGSFLNNRNFKVVVVDADHFTLEYMDASAVDSTAFGLYSSGGTSARIYTIVSPYAYADLATLKFAQSADVITLTHPTYPVYELTRSGATSWALAVKAFSPATQAPDGGTAAVKGSGAFYQFTAVGGPKNEESLPGKEATVVISAASQANPCVVTATTHGYSTGDEVYISGIVGMTQLNGKAFIVTNVNTNNFSLNGVDSSAYTAYASGGTAARTSVGASAAASSGSPNTLAIPAVAGAKIYNVYKALNGVFGFIGVSNGGKFVDTGFNPDTTDTPPEPTTAFQAAGDYPETCGYIQQRLALAGSNNDPETFQLSRVGRFNNFTTTTPEKDDDGISATLTGRQVQRIKHLVELGLPIVFTESGEWSLGGSSSAALTPTQINARQNSYCGASDLRPLVVGSTAVFVQARGSLVRDLAFDWQVDGYRGNDLTIFSAHLVDGFSLVDWAYAQIPNSIIWAVRSDGVLLGLTYIREQQLWGWHRHDFDGTVENVCVVPEGTEDAVYLLVKRTINGRSVRYVERLATRLVKDVVNYNGLDCALGYDGRNAGAHTMTLSGGTTWVYTETLTLTASASTFTSSDVGNAVNFPLPDGSTLRCKITAYTSPTVVSVMASKTVPVSLQAVATATWSKALKIVGGLWHLEGKDVSVLADGFVVANPNNPAYTKITVENGQITLDSYYAVIRVGLPITCDLETLDIDMAQGESIIDKKKLIGKVTVMCEKSRGIFAGTVEPAGDLIPADGSLRELKIRGAANETMDQPVALLTGPAEVIPQTAWNFNGRVFVRQSDPVPLTILEIAPAGYLPIAKGA
jgi:hypothetical protein